MTPEDIAEMQRHEAEVDKAFRKLEETADAAKRGWAKAATEVERLTVELACMTAERDGYRTQLAADWQAKQISDLMAAAGRAHEERDEARRELNDLRESIRDDGTDCTWLADMVRDVITGVSLLGVQSPAEAKRVVSREVHSLLQANLLAARINSQVIDLAIGPIKAAERERDEARAALDRVRELLKRWGSDKAVDAVLVVELHQALDGSGT